MDYANDCIPGCLAPFVVLLLNMRVETSASLQEKNSLAC